LCIFLEEALCTLGMPSSQPSDEPSPLARTGVDGDFAIYWRFRTNRLCFELADWAIESQHEKSGAFHSDLHAVPAFILHSYLRESLPLGRWPQGSGIGKG
jgi:hypothetical protein